MSDPAGRNVWLRRRLPELLVEALLVVFAVLLVLGVDECRQDRMRARRADEAHRSILELAGAGAIAREQELFVEVLESQVSAVVSVERSLVDGYRELLAAEAQRGDTGLMPKSVALAAAR